MTDTPLEDKSLVDQAERILFTSSLAGTTVASKRSQLTPEQLEALEAHTSQTSDDLLTCLRAATPFLRAATQTEWNVLSYIEHFEGADCTPAHIAQEINVTKARVTQICNSLESRGIIERHPDERDRRKVCFTLTNAGHEQCAERTEKFLLLIENYLLLLGPDDTEEFIRLLGRTAQIISEFDMANANAFINGNG